MQRKGELVPWEGSSHFFFFFYHDTGVCSDRVILPDSFTTPNNLEYRQPSSHRFTNSMLLYHQVLPNMKTV